MSTGEDPGAVFDDLLARGQIQLHPDAAALQNAVAATAASSYVAGRPVAVVVDTRDQAAELSTGIRERPRRPHHGTTCGRGVGAKQDH